ncbi:lipopolysaccharide biosynthesis protein [Pseudogracilibacillus sp. SO30301A]|uniref:lipopolysaccharide biosynthesis protein n=1 Tax=Pseudogracilibacillus sp. SO30301A TaxID=3098291 RepID=UPI00300DC581
MIKNNLKNKFVKNVVIVASGTAGAQAITMLFSPIITRLYGPEAFGVMGTFSAMINMIIPIAALTYPIAIVLPKRDDDAQGIVKLSMLVSLILSIISLIIILLFREPLANLFNFKNISMYLYFIPVIIIFSGFMQVLEQWMIRTKQFSINAKATLYQSLIVNISKVGIGFFYPIAQVLVFFTAIANGLRGTLMYLFSDKNISFKSNKSVNIKQLAQKHYDFPVYRAPQDLIDSASQGVPVIMLTTFFGPAAAGFYTIGRTVLRLPTNLIGKAVGDVFYPRIAEAAINKEDVAGLIRKATFSLAIVGIIPFGVVMLFGPFLFSLVFGSDWEMAGEYARWISIWSYFAFMNRPSVRTLPVLNAQKFHLIWTILWTALRIGLLAFTYYLSKDDLLSIAVFCISGTISNALLISITIRLSRKRMMKYE